MADADDNRTCCPNCENEGHDGLGRYTTSHRVHSPDAPTKLVIEHWYKHRCWECSQVFSTLEDRAEYDVELKEDHVA